MNKQIDDMAKAICHAPHCEFKKTNEPCYKYCKAYIYAFRAYNAGYRKQSEVVRCKDCLSCNHCYPVKENGKEAIEGFYCYTHKRYVKPDDFCSFAKMKGDKTDA